MDNSEIITSQPTYYKIALQSSQLSNYLKPTASIITNLFHSKTMSAPYETVSRTQQSLQELENIQKQQVLMNKTQLREFTRKCAQEKVRYQAMIQKLSQDISNRDQRIQNLQHKILQLKQQQEYLITAIEDLRDKHVNIPASEMKIGKVMRLKDEQIEYLNKEISKLKAWLKEEKEEVFRCMECVKLKDKIIENLERENEKLKGQIRPKLKKRKTEGALKTNPGEEEDELTKYKRKAKQMEQHIFQLVNEIDNLRNNNANIKLQLAKANSKYSQPQIQSPIHHLKNVKHQSENNRDEQNRTSVVYVNSSKDHQRYKLLSCKTYQLEIEIEKLMTQIVELKQQNNSGNSQVKSEKKQHRREISFSRTNPGQQIEKEEHFQ